MSDHVCPCCLDAHAQPKMRFVCTCPHVSGCQQCAAYEPCECEFFEVYPMRIEERMAMSSRDDGRPPWVCEYVERCDACVRELVVQEVDQPTAAEEMRDAYLAKRLRLEDA